MALCYNNRDQFKLNHYVKQRKATEKLFFLLNSHKYPHFSGQAASTIKSSSYREINDWRDCNRVEINK